MSSKEQAEHLRRIAQSAEFRRAASEFLKAFWADPERAERISAAFLASWADFKQEAEYQRLVEQMSKAARDNG
jgi:hypothetical protein